MSSPQASSPQASSGGASSSEHAGGKRKFNFNVSPKHCPEVIKSKKGYPNWLNVSRNVDGEIRDRGMWMLKWDGPDWPKPSEITIKGMMKSLQHPVAHCIRETREHKWGLSVYIHSPKQLDVARSIVSEQLTLATTTGTPAAQLYLPRIAMEYLPEVNKLRLTGDTRALNVFILNAHFVGAALQDGVTGERACDIAISSQEHLDSKLEDVRELCDEFGWKADTVSSQACERPCAAATY